MVLEVKPTSPLTMAFPPGHSKRHKVVTGENWDKVASDHGMKVWDLIEYNFPAVIGVTPFDTKCRQVNWLLRKHVGCTTSNDGNNYSFNSSDSPGYIYFPDDLPVPGGGGGKCADWELTEMEREAIREAGGAALLEWAERAPVDGPESKEFKPVGALARDFKALFAWKSCEGPASCFAAPRARLQYTLQLKDDIEYWRARSGSERTALIRQSAQAAMLRAYRWRVISLKQCPLGAQLAEVELGKSLILQMAIGLIAIIPTPKIPGSTTVKQVGSIVGYLAKKLEAFLSSDEE